MSDRSQSAADMAEAELDVREAMKASTPSDRMDAILNLYWHGSADKRDALVAVLAARLTLVPPSSTSSAGAA